MFEKCYECTEWSGNPRNPEEVEMCGKHKIFMRGLRDGCPQYNPREDMKPVIED